MENREMTWEEELQQMELEKEAAKKVYADKLAEEENLRIRNERHKIRNLHKLDCVFLKEYNMTFEETKEYYKDDPEWAKWFDNLFRWVDYDMQKALEQWKEDHCFEDFLHDAPDREEDTKSHIIEKYICG